ncbi:glycogen debranching enzyme [Condylostylus longicornis]|uniref:glycogen debranching enzyme n=1 Tax=Condylostylus longicornis TaxID=2530218 RepID=UPI00244DEB60|nr:glycogen debranching enzyme [Condylostylus longicornis]
MGNAIKFNSKVKKFSKTKEIIIEEEILYNIKVQEIPETTMANIQRVLSIAYDDKIHAESTLYRVKKGSIVRLTPGPSFLGKEIALYTNFPEEAQFIRTTYRPLMFYGKHGEELLHNVNNNPYVIISDVDVYCEVKLNRSGTFRFYFLHNRDEITGLGQYHNKDEKKNHGDGSFYIQVEPELIVGPEGAKKIIPLNSVRCQTVLSKCLGPINTWEAKLRVAKESGYNVVHFTPIQELGGSRSCYSLRNQLKVNPDFSSQGELMTFSVVESVIKKCREEWGIASICDIVLNHTANESDWLETMPEATYSCSTCPYLRPAFLLDAMLSDCALDIVGGALENVGVPQIIQTEDHLQALKYQLHTVYLPRIDLAQLYQCDANAYTNKFIEEMRKREPPKRVAKHERYNEVKIKQDPEYKRLASTIDFDLALEIFNAFRSDCFDEECRLKKCAEEFRRHLDALNEAIRAEIQGYLTYAVDNILAGVRYERVQEGGPMIREVSVKYPIFSRYFTKFGMTGKSLTEIEKAMYGEEGKFFMAHNGWVMGCDDPLKDFAREQPGRANVYLKRELIAWGDSVKLRFGDKPEDNPRLWNHMREYVETTAKIFDGVRLDNCHSTPLHVAEYLLDCARQINPNLYVVAELFTNSDATDNIFVNRLGITSLIREAMSAWDCHEEGRLVYRYGGEPVGAFYSSPKRPLAPTIAHALFLDLTHDNPSPVDKRSIFDLLPSAAVVSMACCATGSNRGYDELVPHHIHVVDEERKYQEWGKNVNFNTGIISAKRALNLLHGQLAEEGFSQVFVDQMHPDIVAITRHNPISHQSVILVAHCSFSNPHPDAGPTSVRSLRFEGCLDEIILEAQMTHVGGKPFDRPYGFKKDNDYINGVNEYKVELKEHIPLTESRIFKKFSATEGNITQLDFVNLKPGSIVAVRASIHANIRPHLNILNQIVQELHDEKGTIFNELENIISKLDLVDLNRALFCCDVEERDMGFGGAAYNIPNFGPTVYCGLQGFISLLTEIAPRNDLGHPLCNNLRDGNWMMDYCANRLKNHDNTKELAIWMQKQFGEIGQIPRYLIPSYFDVILTGIYDTLVARCFSQMPDFIKNGTTFPQSLGLASLQFLARCKSADLPKLSPNIHPPAAPERFVTLSAGLTHFATGYMRCWGRDTFISMRGLMLLTGRFNEARYIIIGFGQCLRHGLIPNLLDNGTKPRFNCRDAVWWWMQSIKDYVHEAPNGKMILNDKVSRLFPTDDSETQPAGAHDQLLYDVMQEALKIHFQGLVYRERNAGTAIDAHMTEKGFNNQIGINPDTGFVFGGNDANCGTWMDKMGSSEKAGNRGKPSTPRDGSAVELVGLEYSVLRFMQEASEHGWIPYKCVERTGKNGQKTTWTYKEWADKIMKNFEDKFFIDIGSGQYVNKHNIYKDSFGASQPWTDYQLRCNFPIAMVVAPEIFEPHNAWEALEQARKHILGPLGMKTLDPGDWAYKGNYDNSNDSQDPTVAHGANYHQGPEWVWPIGFYLRARLIFAKKNGKIRETVAETWHILQAHLRELQTSHWRGLPELTNENGSYCRDSCRTQAWSIATVLEVLHDLNSFKSKH